MARQESDKEDLLREATALVERIELTPIDGRPGANITAGFRPDGAISIFFNTAPVYHFNAAGELRRAYCDELLYKADRGRLISLRRERTEREVQLLRHELSDAEQQAFITRMRKLLADLAQELKNGQYKMVGQVPAESDVARRVQEWLTRHDGTTIAANPRAGASR